MRGKLYVNDPRARDKPCLRCGYSLRKLEEARQCPECGLAVWISLNGNDSLELSNPPWLRRLSLACAVLSLAQAAALLSWLVILIVRLRLSTEDRVDSTSMKWIGLAQEGYLLLYAVPLFLLASAERRYPDKLKAFRRTLLAFGALGIAVGLSIVWSALRTRPNPVTVLHFPGWHSRMSVVVYIAAIPVFLYLRRLARRGPRPRVAKACTGLVIVAVMWILLWLRAGWLELQSLDWVTPVFLIASAGLFFWFSGMLWSSAKEAGRSWATESAGER